MHGTRTRAQGPKSFLIRIYFASHTYGQRNRSLTDGAFDPGCSASRSPRRSRTLRSGSASNSPSFSSHCSSLSASRGCRGCSRRDFAIFISNSILFIAALRHSLPTDGSFASIRDELSVGDQVSPASGAPRHSAEDRRRRPFDVGDRNDATQVIDFI